ncbi:polysaccharide deacetylase family protein [Flavobacterium oreochromis]|uniref:NodB homology domain-containing protein n=1 Tax=Flavobacterium columnare TaxID=996 RepID=A0A246GEF9_9FLAO|nr:polysaccharide deacetylase family protein [Flavobacterium oreochromis]OWP79773.1 hypothetical protein BWK62_00650 [Flavobacterium oreochromis]
MKKIYIILLCINLTSLAQIKVAKINRSVWPYQIHSKTDFDVASKMEMLVFSQTLNEFINEDIDVLKNRIKTKSFNEFSVHEWERKTQNILLNNFRDLSDESLSKYVSVKKNIDWNYLKNYQLEKKIPTSLIKWYVKSHEFYTLYLQELYRLAALFPRITSEIEVLDELEITGNYLGQKQFLLSFDDGPTTVNGNTDKTIQMLEENNLKGIFFVLGQSLQKRLSKSIFNDLYKGHLVGSHGWEHQSHQSYENWKKSIDDTDELIKRNSNTKMIYFRPPYGQRNKKVIHYLKTINSKVMLWNLDSQDWNSTITVNEIADRQITLMLLWRKGILLFHDVHPKAYKAVPLIYNYFKEAQINWVDPNKSDFR